MSNTYRRATAPERRSFLLPNGTDNVTLRPSLKAPAAITVVEPIEVSEPVQIPGPRGADGPPGRDGEVGPPGRDGTVGPSNYVLGKQMSVALLQDWSIVQTIHILTYKAGEEPLIGVGLDEDEFAFTFKLPHDGLCPDWAIKQIMELYVGDGRPSRVHLYSDLPLALVQVMSASN